MRALRGSSAYRPAPRGSIPFGRVREGQRVLRNSRLERLNVRTSRELVPTCVEAKQLAVDRVNACHRFGDGGGRLFVKLRSGDPRAQRALLAFERFDLR